MHRPSSRRVLFASLVSLGLMTGLSVLPAPAQAQVNQRAYAPENLSRLSVSDQSRVISLEYREQSGGRSIPADQLRFYLDQVRESRWTFSQIRADISDSLGNTAGWRRPGTGPANAIRCESTDGRPRTCTTQWQGQTRLLKQLSSTACVLGRSWFTSRGQVTVSNGCRGEFGPGRGNVNAGDTQGTDTIRCESTDNRPRTCTTQWQGQSQLLQQLSSTACVQGRTWFTSRGQVTVSNGCRGEFGPGRGNGNAGDAQRTVNVRCESTDGRMRTCGTELYGRIELQRQLSNTACVQGSTFGLRNGSVWVDRGCRGDFQVQLRANRRGDNDDRYSDNDNDNRNDDYGVTCSSANSRYTTCAWDARRGQPYLIERLSNQACTNGYSWGYSARTGLWVNHGCRARFGTR